MSESSTRQMRLQERILGLQPALPDDARRLHRELRDALITAHNEGLLRTVPAQIHKLVKLDDSKPPHVAIMGATKNFHRDRGLPHFERDDGAWFDFAITVAEKRKGPLELIGYNFELRFPGEGYPPFIRFDLNEPGHANEDRSMRSHLHPGSDDLQVLAPLLSPGEVLDSLLNGLRVERKARQPK